MKKIILIFILTLILLPHKVFAETEEIMSTTQEKFNISGFIKEAEQYMEQSFGDINLTEMLNQAIQGKIDNQLLYKKLIIVINISHHWKLFVIS